MADLTMLSRVAACRLSDVAERLDAGERLNFDDGVRLFEAPDLLAVGWLANRERERRHAGHTFFNHNLRIEATNVCVASCLFCSFARLKPGDPGAYTMSLESDDGSRLYLDGKPVIDNDGLHGMRERSTDLRWSTPDAKPEHQPSPGPLYIVYVPVRGRAGDSATMKVDWIEFRGPGVGAGGTSTEPRGHEEDHR